MSILPQLDPDETIPRMKAVRQPDIDQASAGMKAVPQLDPDETIPGMKAVWQPDADQTSAGTKAVPQLDPDQAILRPIPLKHIDSVIEDIPVEQLPAVVVQDEAKKGQRKRALGLVVRAVVTVLLFAFLLRSVNWSTLVPTLAHVRHSYLLMGLASGVLCVFFSAYGWRSVLLAENIKADLAQLIDLYLVGIGFSHFLPTNMGGDAVKAFYLGRDWGNMARVASATLMSRITSFLGMLLIALPGLAIFHRYFSSQIIIEFLLLSLLLVGGIIGAFLTVAFLPRLSSSFLKNKWTNNRMFVKFLEVGEALSATIRRTRFMFAGTLFGMLFWIASFLNYFGYAAALGLHVPLPFYVIAIPFVSIVTFLPISINGFGVREGTFVYLFSTIHAPASTALLLVLLVDAQVLLFGLIGGCLYSVMSKGKK